MKGRTYLSLRSLMPISSYFPLSIRHEKVFFFLSMLSFRTFSEEEDELYWLLVKNNLLNSSHTGKDMQDDIEP